VCSIAKIDFIVMYAGPLYAQATRHVTTDAGGSQLHESQPDNGRFSNCHSVVRPRRYRRQSQPDAQNEKNERECGGCHRSRQDSTPGDAGDISIQSGFVTNQIDITVSSLRFHLYLLVCYA